MIVFNAQITNLEGGDVIDHMKEGDWLPEFSGGSLVN
jgi:hypothetical protein